MTFGEGELAIQPRVIARTAIIAPGQTDHDNLTQPAPAAAGATGPKHAE